MAPEFPHPPLNLHLCPSFCSWHQVGSQISFDLRSSEWEEGGDLGSDCQHVSNGSSQGRVWNLFVTRCSLLGVFVRSLQLHTLLAQTVAFWNICRVKADGGYQRFGVTREGAGCLMELMKCKPALFLQKLWQLEGKRTKLSYFGKDWMVWSWDDSVTCDLVQLLWVLCEVLVDPEPCHILQVINLIKIFTTTLQVRTDFRQAGFLR